MTDTFSMRDINVTLGALVVGVLICMFLLWASTVQAYVYYGRFPLDPWPVKALIASVLALEWGHSICMAHTFYVLSILQYGNVEELVRLPLSLKVSILLSSAVSSIVQLFFGDRIRRFSGRSFIAIGCWILTFMRLAYSPWQFVAMPNKYIWLALYSYIDRVYSNSLLAILNSPGTRSRTQQQ